MRPVMSALTSTFFFGWIFPLAVTAATRSRLPTVSKRTSMPFSRFALALTITRMIRRTAPPPPNSTLFRLDMAARSSRLTQAAADGGFQRRQGLVIVVRRVHGVLLGAERGDLRIQQLEERPGPDAIAFRGQLQLLPGRNLVRVLQRHRPERGLERQECLADFGLHREPPRPHPLFEVVMLRERVREIELARKVVEDRPRHREACLERLLRELEREDGVPVPDRLLVLRAPDERAAVIGCHAG